MKSPKSLFIETIFEVMVSAVIFGFGFYVLKVGLILRSYIITFLFAILLILGLFALNLLKENMTSKK
jgi:hypothetical protein